MVGKSAASLTIALVVGSVGCSDDTSLGGGGQGGAGLGGAPSGGGDEGGNGGAGGLDPTCDAVTCGEDEFCYAAECHPCTAPAGTQHDLTLSMGDGEEDRFYFLHVPDSYSCGAAAPLLVDFHGTASGERPEEAYQLDALVALSDSVGAIVVRPRSRSSERGGQQIYRWDQNPGDLERNVTYTQNLVEALRSTYRIDGARLYAAGFSSGSNMTSQFLGPARGLFKGLAPIAGGIWSDPGIEPFAPGEAPRIYSGTGYRDYLLPSRRDLVDVLGGNGVEDEQVVVREYDTGHDLYPWHFPELWAFLDEGTRPETGSLVAPWVAETIPSPASIVTLTKRPDGTIAAGGKEGQVWVRSAGGTWSDPVFVTNGGPVTGACSDALGRLFVVGETAFVSSTPDLTFDAPREVPEFFRAFFGASYLNGVGCSGTSPLAAAGYWSGARSDDGGGMWAALAVDAGGYTAQSSAVHVTDTGTIVAVGYFDYIGRGPAGATSLTPAAHPRGSEWLNDVTSAPGGLFWVVGDHGTILHSADDGLTWVAQASPTSEDLYAVAFAADGLHGVAVGRLGTALVTLDGGLSWSEQPTGLGGFLGAVTFSSDTEALIAGEGGIVGRIDLGA